MPAALEPEEIVLTVEDILKRFGPIPLRRIRQDPSPGTATEADLVRINEREGGLCELVDGILVEKDVGAYESLIAARLIRLIGQFVADNELGEVFAPDGFIKLQPGLVRAPDVSYISSYRLGKIRLNDRRKPYPHVAPNLAVEVISAGNTKKEMERKLSEYFEAGVQLVWFVYPYPEEVKVYTSPKRSRTVKHPQVLGGGRVLPGLEISLATLFGPINDRSTTLRIRKNGGK
jgi:Uma2 family endonuclease